MTWIDRRPPLRSCPFLDSPAFPKSRQSRKPLAGLLQIIVIKTVVKKNLLFLSSCSSVNRCYNNNASGIFPRARITPIFGKIFIHGDDRLRRERLVPECEPSVRRTRKLSANFKCQSHFIRRYAPRRLGEIVTDDILGCHVRRHRPPPGDGSGETKVECRS